MNLLRTIRRSLLSLALLGAVAGCAEFVTTPDVAPTGTAAYSLDGTEHTLLEAAELIEYQKAGVVIGPEGGTIETQEGHILHFPAGALADSTLIELEVGSTKKIRAKFAPHGLTFPANARPTLILDYSKAQGNFLETGLYVIYLEDGTVLETLTGTVDTAENTVTVEIDHFSTYGVAAS